GALQHVFQVLYVDVDRAGGEARLRGDCDAHRADRIVRRAHRRALGLLALLTGRAVLPFGQTVDAVVEKQDLHIDIAADDVHEMISADRKRIAVAGDHPDVQLWPGKLQPRREGRSAAVDAVHAVRVHVVRKAAGAADARDEHGFGAIDPELGEDFLRLHQDRVVAATRTPADV